MAMRLSSFIILSILILSVPLQAETLEEWGVRSLVLQNNLDNDAPFNQTTWPGTHNSNSNNDDDDIHGLVLNQSRGLKEQLDEGIRSLVLDVHYTWNEVRVCHNNLDMWGACIENFTGSRKFEKALSDIINWAQTNRNDVVLVKLEMMVSADENINKVIKKVNEYDEYYFMPSSLDDSSFHNLNDYGCKDLPSKLTKSKVLATGKRIILYTDKCYENSKTSDRIFSLGDVENAKDEVDIINKDKSLVIRVKDGATKAGDSEPNMLPSNILNYMDEGINIIETYGYGATGPQWKKKGEYPIAAKDLVWSWDKYEPLSTVIDGTAAVLSSETDKFQTEQVEHLLRPACRKLVEEDGSRAELNWIVGPDMVSFEQAENACLSASNNEYYFATPRNKRELNSLISYRNKYNSTDEAIWLNYQKQSGIWVADIGEADDKMETLCLNQIANVCQKLDDYLDLINASTDF